MLATKHTKRPPHLLHNRTLNQSSTPSSTFAAWGFHSLWCSAVPRKGTAHPCNLAARGASNKEVVSDGHRAWSWQAFHSYLCHKSSCLGYAATCPQGMPCILTGLRKAGTSRMDSSRRPPNPNISGTCQLRKPHKTLARLMQTCPVGTLRTCF